MKKIIITLLALLSVFHIFSQKQIFSPGSQPQMHIKKISDTHLKISIELGQFQIEEKHTGSGNFLLISNSLTHRTFGNGNPMLPQIIKLLDIPFGAHIKIKSLTYKKVQINLDKYFPGVKIIPATPSQRKDSPAPAPVPNPDYYNADQPVYNQIVTTSIAGWLRSYHIAHLTIRPFNYNPVQNTLTAYTHINLELEFVGSELAKTQQIKKHYSSPVYNFNHQIVSTFTPLKSLLQNLPLKLIIVYPDEFLTSALMQFKQWKEHQGFDVVLAPLSQIGTDTTSIRNWLKNYYQTNTHPQDFVLFIGDVDKVPSWPQRTRDQHVTDLYYCEYTGDYLPEVYWGRISADDTTELWNAIQKILAYEQLNLPETSYLRRTLLVAGNDEANEDTYGNGQVYYIQTNYLNSNNGYEVHALYQDPPTGSNYPDTIYDVINQGCALANYSAHCSPQGWADPSFSISNFNDFINQNKLYGVWIANCCQSNKFDEEDAFSEVALHTPGKGVAAYIGGSDYTYWDEDYWWAIGYRDQIVSNPTYASTTEGAFDGYFHTQANEADPSTWYITTGQMVYAGNMAVEQSSSDLKHYYWEIYQVQGDPTLVPFIGIPDKLVVTPSSPIMKGTNQVNLQTSPYTYITVYQGDIRIGTGITDANGLVTIITDYTISEDSLKIYAWGQNKIPVETTLGTVPGIPIVQIQLLTKNVLHNSSDTLLFVFSNTTDTASITNIYANIQAIDTGLLISQDTVYIGTLGPNASDTIAIPCSVGELKDMTTIRMLVKTNQTYDTTTITLYNQRQVTVYSPELNIISFTFTDPDSNQVLDANQTGDFLLTLCNSGHANFDTLSVKISIDTPLAAIQPTTFNSSKFTAGDTLTLAFKYTCQDFSGFTPAKIKAVISTGKNTDSAIINTYFGKPDYITISWGLENITDYPFNNYWENGETQILLQKDEIQFLDVIDELSFKITHATPNGYKFMNLTIGLYQTTLNSLDNFLDTTLFTTVFHGDVFLPDRQAPYYFHLTPWTVDPDKDLIIYIRWGDNGDYVNQSDAFAVAGEATAYTSVLYKNYDIAGVGSDNVYTSTIRPAIKLGKGEFSAVNTTKPKLLDITVYPNPAKDIINIQLPYTEMVKSIKIFSISGKLVKYIPGHKTQVNISGLAQGMYILQITGNHNIYTAKIIKD